MWPLSYGHTHTFFHAGGITRSLIRANVSGSVTVLPSASTYEKPRPRRMRRTPGPPTVLRRSLTALSIPLSRTPQTSPFNRQFVLGIRAAMDTMTQAANSSSTDSMQPHDRNQVHGHH